MKHILSFISKAKILLTLSFWKAFVNWAIHFPPRAYSTIIHFLSFFILLFIFIFRQIVLLFERIPVLGKGIQKIDTLWSGKGGKLTGRLVDRLDLSNHGIMRRTYLIQLGYKNLLAKKTRTLITILGMSVGVGVIVLLLSLGYGIESLVISKVANLNELKVIDVTVGASTAQTLNDDILAKIKRITKVSQVMPVVSFVGRVTFNNAKSDVLVYSSSNRFMRYSNLKFITGKQFENNEVYSKETQKVAGAETVAKEGRLGQLVNSDGDSLISALPDKPATVRSSCSTTATVLGLMPRIEGQVQGEEVWGENYDRYFENSEQVYDSKNGIFVAAWYKGTFPIYYEASTGTYLPLLDVHGRLSWETGCVEAKEVQMIDKYPTQDVLGVATDSASLGSSSADLALALPNDTSSSGATDSAFFAGNVVSTDANGLQVVSLATTSGSVNKDTIIHVGTGISKQAVVSTALLSLFNIPVNQAVGKEFQVSFIITKSLLNSLQGKASTDELPYTIIGVVRDDSSPYFYVPLSDLQKIKVDNFSQLKVVVDDGNLLAAVRKTIETFGFRTTSTADTVAQIESLFNNIRLLLGLLGLVALAVASLGMFNTLTVSLLERTREIGGLKTMGMVSNEVQDLFLAEAMVMGLAGGFGGLFLGFIIGQLLSFLVSLLALANGQGYLQLTYIPPFLTFFIIISSFVVGLITGLYPSRRARKISALNALRYE